MKKTQNFLFVVFTIVVIVVSKQYEISSFKSFYFFKMTRTSKVNGVVLSMEKSDDMSGVVSYKYTVRYNVNNINYTLSERLSPDSLLNIRTYSTVPLQYSIKQPSYATLKNLNSVYYNFLLSIVIIVFEIFLFKKSVKIIFLGENVSTQTE